MANFTITTQAQTASVAMSTERLNQNWSDINLGLTFGEKDIAIANATAARSVNANHAVVTSSITAARGFVEQTATVAGLLEGTRCSVIYNATVHGGFSGYMLVGTQQTMAAEYENSVPVGGVTMPRSGSVIGIAWYWRAAAVGGTTYFTPCVYKNAASLVSASSKAILISSTGAVSTFTRGSHAFTAGDTLQLHTVASGGTGNAGYVHCLVEVVLDT